MFLKEMGSSDGSCVLILGAIGTGLKMMFCPGAIEKMEWVDVRSWTKDSI